MITLYAFPNSVVLVTCNPFAAYVVPAGTEGPLASRLASNDVQNNNIGYFLDEVTGKITITKFGNLFPETNLFPATNLYLDEQDTITLPAIR